MFVIPLILIDSLVHCLVVLTSGRLHSSNQLLAKFGQVASKDFGIRSIYSLFLFTPAAPMPANLKLGDKCKSSMECLLFVGHTHCDWDSRVCTCQPYYILHKDKCLPGLWSAIVWICSFSIFFFVPHQLHYLATHVPSTSSAHSRCPIPCAKGACASVRPITCRCVRTSACLVSVRCLFG